jgi:hypothetical protein
MATPQSLALAKSLNLLRYRSQLSDIGYLLHGMMCSSALTKSKQVRAAIPRSPVLLPDSTNRLQFSDLRSGGTLCLLLTDPELLAGFYLIYFSGQRSIGG